MADTKPGDDRTMQQRVADLELALAQAQAGSPLGTLPEHGAGIGQEVEETWSQADQEMARAGTHPFQDEEEQKPPGAPAPSPTPHK